MVIIFEHLIKTTVLSDSTHFSICASLGIFQRRGGLRPSKPRLRKIPRLAQIEKWANPIKTVVFIRCPKIKTIKKPTFFVELICDIGVIKKKSQLCSWLITISNKRGNQHMPTAKRFRNKHNNRPSQSAIVQNYF